MTLEEMFRRIVRAHLGIILVCILLPMAGAAVLAARRPDPTVASLRMQVISAAPTSATQADALNSRVLAVATTPSLLSSALKAAKAPRDVTTYALKNVTAQRLGNSPIVELSVSDDNAAAAKRIVSQLATRVTQFMNQGDQATFQATMTSLVRQIDSATATRDQLVAQLRGIADVTTRSDLSVRIQTVEQLLSQLIGQRATLMATEATRDQVVLVSDTPDAVTAPSSMLPQLALALLLGLVLGLTTATLLETFRPRVNSIRALAHILEAPVLGKTSEPIENLRNTLALAARRQGVDAVVLMGADDSDAATVNKLLIGLSDRSSTPERAKKPAGRDDAGGVFDLGDATLSGFADVRFTGLPAVTPEDELTAGVVVVSGGNVLLRRLDDLDDVLKAVRWPVLGVVQRPAKRRFGRSR
ncbi:hypothetical protein GCM10009804_67820 [Kribbella hippodromi]|uniref:Polysaccharide chain length determinant N-terminal domain-containing protein n=1 Tax=Kribbella hippodromi TaxID=434347 RepID=A0ABN2EBP8_9ACTN